MSLERRASAKGPLPLALALCLSLLVLLAAAAWITRSALASHETIALYVTGDTRNYLEPCGCRRDQAGGLGGRMTILRSERLPRRLVFDVGNLTSGGREHERLKLRALMEGMRIIGYDAVNLGAREAALGATALREVMAEGELPFVSCNLLSSKDGSNVAEPYRIVEAAGLRVGVTGFVEMGNRAVGEGLVVRPEAEALSNLLPDLAKRCDTLVVLGFAGAETLQAVANRFHEIDILLGGDVPQSSSSAEALNRAIGFSVTGQGKVIGRLALRRSGREFALADSKAIRVADDIRPDPEMVALIERYRNELRERNLEFSAEEGMEPISPRRQTRSFAGDSSCGACHTKPHRATAASAHMHGYETLVRVRAEFDPDCLPCHTVGFGQRGGFRSAARTPDLKGVQCESCHGPAEDHARAMKSGASWKNAFRPVTPGTCIRCHDEENSENFVYESYWPKIRH